MSHTVKTYGRRNGGVAFPSSRATPKHVFSASSTNSSDGNGDSPPSCAAAQRRNKSKKADAENSDVKVHKKQGTSKTGISASHPVHVKSHSNDSGRRQMQPRRPLADINGPADALKRAALPEKPRKLRCKNRRKTIKSSLGSVPIVDNIPDFSDIENHSLFIVSEDDGRRGCPSAAMGPVGAYSADEPLEQSQSPLSSSSVLFLSSSQRMLTRSQCQAAAATAPRARAAATTTATREGDAAELSATAGRDWSLSARVPLQQLLLGRGIGSSAGRSGRPGAAATITPLGGRSMSLLGGGGLAISTPQAHVASDSLLPALDDEADVSAIAIEDEASSSPYQIMTRSRLQQLQRSATLFDTLHDGGGSDGSSDNGCCYAAAAQDVCLSLALPGASIAEEAPEAGAAARQRRQHQVQSCEQSVTCPASCSRLRTRSLRSVSAAAQLGDGAAESGSCSHRSTRHGVSTLSVTGAATLDRLESIAEVVHAEDAVDMLSKHSVVGTPSSMIKMKMQHLLSPGRRSLAEIFPPGPVSDVGADEEAVTTAEVSLAVASPRETVLCECGQDDYVPFSDVLLNCDAKVMKKVGEGVFGEVFLLRDSCGNESVIKIVPIEGDFKVNDEPQKTFDEILPEIVISRELSSLSCTDESWALDACCSFIHLASVLCAQGKYPHQLLQAWSKHDQDRGSENDCPSVFGDDQLFIIFEFENGGTDLESFQFANLGQGLSVLRQVAYGLAVAEGSLQFEHRDLHWGNVLVKAVDDPEAVITYAIGGHVFNLPTNGVCAKIIDYTLSRLEKDGRTIFMDLSTDESLFTGKGDYQFDIYRKMKEHNENDWESFSSYSNVLWIHYLADKIANAKVYPRSQQTKECREQMRDLRHFLKRGLEYVSALHVVMQDSLFVASVQP